MSHRRALARVFLLAVSAAACTVWKKPTVVFEGVTLHGLTQNGASLDVRLRVDNPNSYRIVVQRFTYRLSIGGTPAGGGQIDSDVAIDSRAGSDVELPVALDWSELKGRVAEFLFSGGVDYSVEGEIRFSTPVGTFTRPYVHSGKVSPRDSR